MSDWTAEQIDALTERLSAYLDGEANAAEARELTALLERDATARRILEELREMQTRVGALPNVSAPADLSGRVLAAIEREELLEGGPIPDAPEPSSGRRWFQLLASAALVALAVGVGYYAFFLVTEPTATTPRRLVDQFAKADKAEPSALPAAPAGGDMGRAGESNEEAAPPAPSPKSETAEGLASVASRDKTGSFRKQRLSKAGAPAAGEPEAKMAMSDAVTSDVAAAESASELGESRSAGARLDRQGKESYLKQQTPIVSNQINIVVESAEAQQELNRQLPRLLAQNAIVAEDTATPEQQASPRQSLYYADANVQQVLVRADISSLNTFLGDVQSAFPDAQIQPISNAPGISYVPSEMQTGIAGSSMTIRSDPTAQLETDTQVTAAGQANRRISLPPPGEERDDDESRSNKPQQAQRMLQVQNAGALAADEPIFVQFNLGPTWGTTQPSSAPATTSPSSLRP